MKMASVKMMAALSYALLLLSFIKWSWTGLILCWVALKVVESILYYQWRKILVSLMSDKFDRVTGVCSCGCKKDDGSCRGMCHDMPIPERYEWESKEKKPSILKWLWSMLTGKIVIGLSGPYHWEE